MDITEITTMLGTILGIITPLGAGGAILYRRQNKRLKEAEAALAEVNVDKGRIESKKQETDRLLAQIDHQQSTIDKLTERNEKLVEMNAEKEDRHQQDIKDWQERFDKATDRTREVQREREYLWNENAKLIKALSDTERERDFYKMWFCRREFGNEKCDPDKCGRREPQQSIPIKFIPLDKIGQAVPSNTSPT